MGRSDGLRTIFSFFLGLMLTAFFGVGAYTFYPPPEPHEREMRELSRAEREIHAARAPEGPAPADRERLREIERRRSELVEAAADAREPWGRTTSIVLISLATLTMAVSLVRADQLPVISNGLLLGGVFTMLYGVGWILATDASVSRFVVMTIALAITLGLGYLRFVRQGPAPVAAAAAATGGEGLAALERRVLDLEVRLDDAAQALGPPRTPGRSS
jgi:hypothetical protein